MRFFLLVTALAHAVHSGNVGVRTSNLLSPADVTYVDGSYHAGLSAGPIAYSASAPQPLLQAYAAPAPKYAAIPTVQHVQGVADVPVTRVDAQPAVIQKTVDVARPAVKTQRYEVRRPAIQKQFYDIEERVVVRPAGSAVVELDEPLSRTQKGPSVIQPTGEGVAVASSSVTVPAAPAAAAPAPAELPSVEINLARASLPASAVGIAAAPSVGIAAAPSVGIAAAPSVGVAAAPAVGIAAAPAPAVGIARASFAPAPSVEVRTAVPAAVAAAPAPLPSVAFARTAPAAPAVEVRTTFPAQVQSAAYPAQYQSVGVSVPVKTVTGVSTISSGASGIASVPVAPSQVTISTPAPQYQHQILQTTPASDDSISVDSADFRSSAFSRPPTNHHAYAAAAQPPAPRTSLLVNYPNPIDLVPQQRFTAPAAYAQPNYQSQINHENQQRLIQLLTARGGVSEVGFGRSGPASYPQEAGQVRARVLSATPAPPYAPPTGERVNTRRVVVSRPIETLQEVEVAEPVTKYERHQVDQPAVVKTATQDVLRVPTSVPVYGKTLAPIADAPYPAGWH